jgi:predicted lipoprotein with Yx(FWY)xxD motif
MIRTVLFGTACLLLAWTSSGATVSPANGAPSPPRTASIAAVTVGTRSTALRTVLTGPTGVTLYTHAGDSATSSTCTGPCLAAWPPLTVSASQLVRPGPGVSGRLATFARPEGTSRVTYNGLPLYYWKSDTKPGDVTGRGTRGFSLALVAGARAAINPADIAPCGADDDTDLGGETGARLSGRRPFALETGPRPPASNGDRDPTACDR